jgi:hypothetical protein
MKNWSGRLALGSAAAAVVAVAALVFLQLAPGRLRPHALVVWRVEQKSDDREAAELLAQLTGESPFFEMYNVVDSDGVEVVLPPRGSFDHRVATLFARLLQVDGAVAAREDVLADSPEPGKKFFINNHGPFALQMRAVYFFVSRLSIGCVAAFLIFGGLCSWLRRRSRRAAC